MTPLPALVLVLLAAQATVPGAEDGAASETRFFPRTIDFWKSGPRAPAPRADAAPGPAMLRESIWAEPVRQPDGRFAITVPPKPVLDFLEDPTPESLKGYLDWKRARAQKLKKALELLGEVQVRAESGREKESPPADPPASAPPAPPSKVELTYFHGKACPHSTKQDPILAGWLSAHPEASMRVLELGESPELWLKHRVRGTPSLLLSEGSVEPGILLEGFSDRARLDRALDSLRTRPRQPTIPDSRP